MFVRPANTRLHVRECVLRPMYSVSISLDQLDFLGILIVIITETERVLFVFLTRKL